MKRFLAILLSIVFVWLSFGILPSFAEDYADDEAAIAAGMYFRVDGTEGSRYYASLMEAITGSSGSPTVYLLQDCATRTPVGLGSSTSASFTLDGQGHTITDSNSDGAYLWYIKGYSTTFKNFTLNVADQPGIRFVPRFENCRLTLDNVTINFNTSTNTIRDGFICCGHYNDVGEIIATTATITIRDSVISGNSAPVWAGHDGKASYTINIENSTLENKWGSGTWPYAILLYDGAHGTGNNTKTLNVDGTSKLIISTDQSNFNNPAAIRIGSNSGNAPGTCSVNLEQGAELKVITGANAKAGKFINIEDSSKKLEINDDGAIYTASVEAQKKGVMLPPITSYQGIKIAEAVQFSNGDETVEGGKVYQNENAGKETSFRVVPPDLGYEELIAAENIWRVGAEELPQNLYSSLDAAYAAAPAGETIYLLGDALITTPIDFTKANVTVNGGGYTITVSTGYAFRLKNTTTFKNAVINCSAQGFSINPTDNNQVFTLDGVNITCGSGLVASVGHSNGTVEKTESAFVVKNSTLTTGNGSVLLLQKKITWTVDIQNSTLRNNSTNKDNDPVLLIGWDVTMATLNLDGTTKLISNSTVTSDEGRPSVLCVENSATNVINLASGTELKIGEVARVFRHISANKSVLHDQGAKMTASPAAQKIGVKIPPAWIAEGKTVYGFLVGGALYGMGAVYQNETAEADAEIKPIYFNSSDFQMVDGASTRTALPYGLRFTATISKDTFDTFTAMDPDFEYGLIIAKTKKVVGNFDVASMSIADVEWIPCTEVQDAGNGTYRFRKGIYGFKETKAEFETAYSAIAYMKVHFGDGSEVTLYTSYDPAKNSRSIYDIAFAASQHGVADPMLNRILSICNT